MNKFLGVMCGLLVFVVAGLVVYGGIVKNSYQKQLVEMQNALASRDQTIETQKGAYDRLAIEKDGLEKLLDTTKTENKKLKDELDQKKQEIITLTNVVITWKKAYEAEIQAHQSEVDGRTKVEFSKDFGYLGVSGYTLTNPPIAFVKIQQNAPLRLAIAVTQDETKAWHTVVTTNDDNLQVNIELSSVNPYLTSPKWYEKIGVGGMLGVGATGSGLGGVMGLSATYRIGDFDVGPFVLVGVSDRLDKFIGINTIWHPFARN